MSSEDEVRPWSLKDLEVTNPTLHSVYDGDTFRLVLPVCCKKYIFPCRLNGADTPEVRTKNLTEKRVGQAVRDYVTELLESKPFRVRCGNFDKYGRVLCDVYIHIDENEVSLSDHLIEKGYAYAYGGNKKRKFEDWYEDSLRNIENDS